MIKQNNLKNHSKIVTLSEFEYKTLKKQALAYRFLAAKIFELSLHDPIEDVVQDFKNTNLYTKKFLTDLESGLRKSSYLKKYAD